MAKVKKKRKERTRKEKAPKKHSKKHKAYEVSGDKLVRKLASCPKCGEGVHLAKHADRSSCGKCGYTEFTKKE